MNGTSHTMRRAITAFGLAAGLAAFVAPSALASAGNSPPISYTGASTTQGDVSTAAMWARFKHDDAVSSSHIGLSSQCPCNSGLVDGPRVSIPARGSSTPDGFNWGAAGIGAGGGLALIALAVGTLAGRAGNDPIKQRRRLARRLERAASPERPFVGRGPRYLVQPNVSAACALSLRAIAAALRDETLVVESDQLGALLRFVSNGDSPFFGDDPTAALREAVRLQHNVVGAEPAALEFEQSTVAA